METTKLIDYVKAQGAVKLVKMQGPNGAFISCEKADGTKFTMPVGKKSQGNSLVEYNVLVAENGQAIATANNYSVAEEITL